MKQKLQYITFRVLPLDRRMNKLSVPVIVPDNDIFPRKLSLCCRILVTFLHNDCVPTKNLESPTKGLRRHLGRQHLKSRRCIDDYPPFASCEPFHRQPRKKNTKCSCGDEKGSAQPVWTGAHTDIDQPTRLLTLC